MKQYTNKEQTQHLIELGFPRPKSISGKNYMDVDDKIADDLTYDYSIGELIEFLGVHLMGIKLMETYEVYAYKKTNDIEYVDWFNTKGELIDALYEACVKLKNEGVI